MKMLTIMPIVLKMKHTLGIQLGGSFAKDFNHSNLVSKVSQSICITKSFYDYSSTLNESLNIVLFF